MPRCPLALLVHEQIMLKTCSYRKNAQAYIYVQDSILTTHIEYTNTDTLKPMNAFYTQLLQYKHSHFSFKEKVK